jgi:hypothetical protein
MKNNLKEILDTKEKYGVTINLHDFGQTVFEEYQTRTIKAGQEAFYEFSGGQGVTATAFVRGMTVRTALSLGILSGIETKDIADMKPFIVTWIADEIKAHVTRVVSEPADPNS